MTKARERQLNIYAAVFSVVFGLCALMYVSFVDYKRCVEGSICLKFRELVLKTKK